MDQTDKRILALLDRNARISFAALGREISLSRTAVQDRVAKLEADGVIKGYHADYATEQSRLIHAMLFVKIAVRPCDPALNWLASLDGVHEVLSLSGEIDAIVKCVVPSPNDLTKLNDAVGASTFIATSTSSLVLRTHRPNGCPSKR